LVALGEPDLLVGKCRPVAGRSACFCLAHRVDRRSPLELSQRSGDHRVGGQGGLQVIHAVEHLQFARQFLPQEQPADLQADRCLDRPCLRPAQGGMIDAKIAADRELPPVRVDEHRHDPGVVAPAERRRRHRRRSADHDDPRQAMTCATEAFLADSPAAIRTHPQPTALDPQPGCEAGDNQHPPTSAKRRRA
jgi:hypothetical protein